MTKQEPAEAPVPSGMTWDMDLPLAPWARYPLAVMVFAIALATRFFILPVEAGLAFLTFYPATALTALLFGSGPGLLTTALGAVIGHYVFMAPHWSFKAAPDTLLPMAIFVASGIVVCLIAHQKQRHAKAVKEANRQLKLAMAELHRSNQELDEFAYIASHDLKEPLRGIHNYASFLLEDYAQLLDDEGRSYLDRMQRLAERQSTLIDRLLAYSRLGAAPLARDVVDLEAVVGEVAEDMAAALEKDGVELRRPNHLPSVTGDALRIGEVFQNLIANALKYNDKPKKMVEVGCQPTLNPPVFHVRDNGIGIPPQHKDNVFRIFKRLHEQNKFGGGTGAGLTIVKKIIERHGGRIWLESTPGMGTTFYFTLTGEHDSGQ